MSVSKANQMILSKFQYVCIYKYIVLISNRNFKSPVLIAYTLSSIFSMYNDIDIWLNGASSAYPKY